MPTQTTRPPRLPLWPILCAFCWGGFSACGPAGKDPASQSPPRHPEPAQAAPAAPGSGSVPSAAAAGLKGSGVGRLAGRVRYRGPLPKTTVMHIPEAGFLEAHTLIVDPQEGLKNAVVWVEAPAAVSPLPESAAGAPDATIDQLRWTFQPHVLAIRRGQKVRFLNSDLSNHTIHSYSPGQEFHLGTPLGQSTTYTFRRATGGRPIRVECDIHHWMRGWIYVFETPYFAVTDARGGFEINGLPEGEWTVEVHHADGGLHEKFPAAITAGETLQLDFVLSGPLDPEPPVEDGK